MSSYIFLTRRMHTHQLFLCVLAMRSISKNYLVSTEKISFTVGRIANLTKFSGRDSIPSYILRRHASHQQELFN